MKSIFIESTFDRKKKLLLVLFMAIPIIPINDFCDNFSIECLNKIALIDNTCIFMGDLDINLLKSHANNVTSIF